MDAKRGRTKSATWRKGQTPGGVEYYFARRPVHKARDFEEPRVKSRATPKKRHASKPMTPVPSRAVREKARKREEQKKAKLKSKAG